MIKARIFGERVVSNSEEAFSLYEASRFGEKKGQKIEYMNVEALFLVSCGRMVVTSGKKVLCEEKLILQLKKFDKRVETKFVVFSDLRKKGYIVKTALKFGAEFRVYEKGVKPGEEHARWLVYSVRESERLDWYDFAAKNRVAHSAKKNLMIALVDEEGDVTYYEVMWLKP